MFHCSVIKVPVVLATAILDYHNQEGLSRTFFYFFETFFSSCFRLFLSFSTASLDYHILLGLSRTFLKFLQLLLLSSLYIKKVNNCSSQQLVYFIISFCLCQQVFSFFFIFYLSLQSPAIHHFCYSMNHLSFLILMKSVLFIKSSGSTVFSKYPQHYFCISFFLHIL